MTKNCTFLNRILISVCLCVVLVIMLLPLAAQAAPSAIPPVPTRTPTPTPTPVTNISTSDPIKLPDGGRIELRVKFLDTWSETGMHWQDLWTIVQWQDERGRWHKVEGWQGTLDEVQDAVGKKIWWVAEADLGKGPFRWMVHRSQGGGVLVISEAFYLPANVGQLVLTEVVVQP